MGKEPVIGDDAVSTLRELKNIRFVLVLTCRQAQRYIANKLFSVTMKDWQKPTCKHYRR